MINVKDLIKNKNAPITIIVVIVGLISAKNLYQFQANKINLLKTKIEDYKERSVLVESNQSLEKKINGYNKAYAKKDASFYFDKINELIYENGLEVVSFEPLKEDDGGVYVRLPYRLVLKGSYHQLGKFLSRIENSSDIFEIKDLSIASTPDYSEKQKLSFNLTIAGVSLK